MSNSNYSEGPETERRAAGPQSSTIGQQFDQDWDNTVHRFRVITGMRSLKFNLSHPVTSFPLQPHEALPTCFEEWKTIQSLWDRRSLFYTAIYQMARHHLKPWQIANYLTEDRRPVNALSILQKVTRDDLTEDDYAPHCAALAKTLMALTYYEESLEWAQRASQAAPQNSYFQVLLADAYSFCGYDNEAGEIYQKCVATVPSSFTEPVTEIFSNFFSRETGAVPSPILALQIANKLTGVQQYKEFWMLAEDEFYDSPFFRMQHAYYLAEMGFLKECFAKLYALVQEMPWLREASMNLMILFEHFNQLGSEFNPELQAQLKQTIQKNDWTTEGMQVIKIASNL
ncbi:M48 family metallopeptidase [Synechococcus sp. PCC 7336]|uniref:tetratricopeptide repeat protein n=1 Tax=Synechococcus sp. PCC 7336 TaxID=195250 RepID=UPI00034A8BB0|nr:tetratricopeptide repeat protein [Synechococcus sp. PCC 7336]